MSYPYMFYFSYMFIMFYFFSSNNSSKNLGVMSTIILWGGMTMIKSGGILGFFLFILFLGGIMVLYLFLIFVNPSRYNHTPSNFLLNKVLAIAFLMIFFWMSAKSMPSNRFNLEEVYPVETAKKIMSSSPFFFFLMIYLMIFITLVSELTKSLKNPLRNL